MCMAVPGELKFEVGETWKFPKKAGLCGAPRSTWRLGASRKHLLDHGEGSLEEIQVGLGSHVPDAEDFSGDFSVCTSNDESLLSQGAIELLPSPALGNVNGGDGGGERLVLGLQVEFESQFLHALNRVPLSLLMPRVNFLDTFGVEEIQSHVQGGKSAPAGRVGELSNLQGRLEGKEGVIADIADLFDKLPGSFRDRAEAELGRAAEGLLRAEQTNVDFPFLRFFSPKSC